MPGAEKDSIKSRVKLQLSGKGQQWSIAADRLCENFKVLGNIFKIRRGIERTDVFFRRYKFGFFRGATAQRDGQQDKRDG